jgi:hypothetical protein
MCICNQHAVQPETPLDHSPPTHSIQIQSRSCHVMCSEWTSAMHILLSSLHYLETVPKPLGPSMLPGSPHLLPISQQLTQMLQTGDFRPLLLDPMKRMRMTLHCAQCGVAYPRSNDLMLHLQTAHSAMWNKAQAMTRLIVKVLSPTHACVCNPSVNKVTLTHVCPLYRQMAMLSTRSAVELFLP